MLVPGSSAIDRLDAALRHNGARLRLQAAREQAARPLTLALMLQGRELMSYPGSSSASRSGVPPSGR
jgi:hypothetical protein